MSICVEASVPFCIICKKKQSLLAAHLFMLKACICVDGCGSLNRIYSKSCNLSQEMAAAYAFVVYVGVVQWIQKKLSHYSASMYLTWWCVYI